MAGSQDMFDAIVMADERFHGEGYQQGYEKGSSLGIVEGRQHGTVHGARTASEIGCYQGFALAWKCLLCTCTSEKDSKKLKVLESLIAMIEKFPYGDPTYEKLQEDLEKIRGKFKQLCALLKVQPDFRTRSEGSGLSF
ncbi:protein LTO1 homolog [Rhynchocyon petersi]